MYLLKSSRRLREKNKNKIVFFNPFCITVDLNESVDGPDGQFKLLSDTAAMDSPDRR